FYEISSPDEEPALAAAAYKSGSYRAPLTAAQKAWLTRVKKLAPAVSVAAAYSPTGVPKVIAQLRALLHQPQEIRHVPRLLREAGIKFMIIEALPGTKIDGACLWIDGQPVIAMSLRFNRIDNFWFVLMHELVHVMNAD